MIAGGTTEQINTKAKDKGDNMNSFQLLNQFAKEHGISEEEVNEFANKISNVNTLNELGNLPKDMLTHYKYKDELRDKMLKEYIGEFITNRYETKTLDDIMDSLLDEFYVIAENYKKILQVYDYEEFEREIVELDISIMSDEDKKKIERLLNIRQAIIDNKFGSIKWDW